MKAGLVKSILLIFIVLIAADIQGDEAESNILLSQFTSSAIRIDGEKEPVWDNVDSNNPSCDGKYHFDRAGPASDKRDDPPPRCWYCKCESHLR